MVNFSERGIKGVVILAAVDWNFLRQRVHHFATSMAQTGLKVLFIENTAVRSPKLGDLPRIIQRLRIIFSSQIDYGGEPVPKNLTIYSPLAAPWPYKDAAVAWNHWLLYRKVRRFLMEEKLRPEEVLLYTYLATPLVLRLIEDYPWARVVYDVVSDPKQVEPRLAPFEEQLLRRANITLFASATLLEQYHVHTKNPVLFRDGFSTELLDAEIEIPPDVAKLPRPRLLYIGGINRKLWVEAIEALCEAVPHGSIILMGPVAYDEVELPKLPNLYLLPPRQRYIELAGVLRAADVGLIPYRPDPYASAMHPAKLNEYLVFGLPVVATATVELKRLATEMPDRILYLADSPEKFSKITLNVLSSNFDEVRRICREITLENTWLQRLHELMNIIV
ncbi:MAG: glycosyltransferase [Firmicutes bacterium]|nr:glycosyltransferase [Bacillota bacterium]